MYPHDYNFIFDNGPQVEVCATNWAPANVFFKYYHLLKKERQDLNMMYIDAGTLRKHATIYTGPNCVYGPHYLMIKNVHTGRYFLVSYCDTNKDIFFNSGFVLDFLEDLYTSSGIINSDIDFKRVSWLNYKPFSYVPSSIECEQELERLHLQNIQKTIPDKPRFRSFPADPFRSYLLEDKRFDCLDKRVNYLTHIEYMNEIFSHKIGLSVNGHGEICHRDMEILGAGNVLLRTKLVVDMHDPLIPDYHYVAVEVNNFRDYQSIADKLISKYNEIKDKPDYLDFIAKNGREWYLKNGCTDGNANLLLKLLDFNRLI